LKILQEESWGIFNLQSWIEDSPPRVLENLQSSIFNPGLQPIPERDQEMPEIEEMSQAEVTEESQAAE